MSAVSAARKTPYEMLLELPENVVGEIINGQLYTQPRPAKPHALACASLKIDIGSAYHKGRGGAGRAAGGSSSGRKSILSATPKCWCPRLER